MKTLIDCLGVVVIWLFVFFLFYKLGFLNASIRHHSAMIGLSCAAVGFIICRVK